MKTIKKCIFCQKEFKDAPPEHVIPKSIGGQYTIHSVCQSCNNSLNKKIDEPFKDHQLISIYRFKYSTTGRGKGIKNPLVGKKIDIDGIKYNAKLNDDLTIDVTMEPKFPKISDLKIGDTNQIQIDEKDIEKFYHYQKKVAEKLGIPIEEVQVQNVEKTIYPEREYILKTENSIVYLEFSKILFQATTDIIGNAYLDDPLAIQYRTMLMSGQIDKSIREYISPNSEITAAVLQQLLPSAQNMSNQHLVIILGFVGIGLVGFLKMYDSYHVQILSTSSKFYKTGMKIIMNDFKNNKLGIFEPNKIPYCNIDIDPVHVQNNELQTHTLDTNYTVFNSKGEIVAKSLFELVNNYYYPRKVDTDFTTKMNVTLFFFDTIFIKSKPIDKLIPIESVTYNFSITTRKGRGL